MADIKQAAKWMQEGKKVRRSVWGILSIDAPYGTIRNSRVLRNDNFSLNLEDVLADDWELAEERHSDG
jgi:hypothetical protein